MSDLFTTPALSYEEEKKPTLLQYLKAKDFKKLPKSHHVQVIWLPNRFASFSIETDWFRLSVPKNGDFGRLLDSNMPMVIDRTLSVSLIVTLSDERKPLVSMIEGKEIGIFSPISDPPLGYRFQIE